MSVLALACPHQALAAWGDESWGQMVWGQGFAVPAIGWLGLAVLAMGLVCVAAWTLRKRRPGLGLPLMLVVLAIPLAVVAGTVAVPNTFVNGEVADAEQVNDNFAAVELGVNDNDARITSAESNLSAAQAAATAAQAAAGNAVTNAASAQAAAGAAQVTANGAAAAAAAAQDTANAAQASATENAGAIEALHNLPAPARFEACGDGLTVVDHQTGLTWEKKTNPSGLAAITFLDRHQCSAITQPAECAADPHDVRNGYAWTSGLDEPDGVAYTDFLARLNGSFDPHTPGNSCYANRCDWRLPVVSELQAVLVGPNAAGGQQMSCAPGSVCLDPGFAAVVGPTATSFYWSASTLASNTLGAWYADFGTGNVDTPSKTFDLFVRAVRTGSCVN